jgi:TonB family protein
MFFVILLAVCLGFTTLFWVAVVLTKPTPTYSLSFWERYQDFFHHNYLYFLAIGIVLSTALTINGVLQPEACYLEPSSSCENEPNATAAPPDGLVRFYQKIGVELAESRSKHLFEGDEVTYIAFEVLPSGLCIEHRIVGSSGNPHFDIEALRIMKKNWRWQPGTDKNGTAVGQSVTVAIDLK